MEGMAHKKQKHAEGSNDNSSRGYLDLIAAPLNLLGFALLLDCLKIFPHAFPLRTEGIAGILNRCLPPHEQVDPITMYNVIDKLMNSPVTSETAGAYVANCVSRPNVQAIAEDACTRFVAFPRAIKCILCSCRLKWVDTNGPRRPFLYPDGAGPSKGIVQEKICPSCNTLFSVGFYSPGSSGARKPYPADLDSQAWLELSEETMIGKDLLRRHDNNL
jgi:hypothetical protein